MSNRLLLAGVVGLAAINGLLCLAVVFRENANGQATQALRGELEKARQDSADESKAIREVLDGTRKHLGDVTNSLNDANKRLAETESALAAKASQKAVDDVSAALGSKANQKAVDQAALLNEKLASAFKKLMGRVEKLEKERPPAQKKDKDK